MSGNITTLTNSSNSTFRIAGGKTGVLLIHGLCGTPAEMRFVATGLARAGYTVHCPTLAGHGGGRAEVVKTTWQDWYRSAEVALDELRKECDTVIVGGLCLGSIIGLHLAANHPDKIQGVALFSPTLWIDGWAMPWYTKLFSLVRTRWIANLMQFPDAESLGIKCPRVREFVRAALACSDGSDLGTVGTPGAMVLEHRRLTVAVRRLLGKVRQPTLIIHSREDDYASLENAAYLQAKLAAPVDLCVLDDSYHMITLDKQRHVVVERTCAFIGRFAKDGRMATPKIGANSMPVGAA
ncbi:alpha/beta fold hydrolase [Hyphomicrobium sp.]|uniref:alpha/beta hydrolase n=1 Tax=Hyphomicrobium sp. TaxID=82 RepID=UPI000FBC54FB|nr:alpha/beta fold hydrolase [Hyphomicrobium sp.]RUP00026.1 MAG: alpha/beta fold hydrolase [Hyphomicrobium sp.]